MDAWYPRLVHAAFDGQLSAVYGLIPMGFDDAPSNGNVGSSYIDGYYGYLSKTFRQALGRRVRGRFRALHCADGTRRGCAAALRQSLHAAVAELTATFGSASPATWHANPRADDIHFALGGLATVPSIPWQNRPTFQQVVQVRP